MYIEIVDGGSSNIGEEHECFFQRACKPSTQYYHLIYNIHDGKMEIPGHVS